MALVSTAGVADTSPPVVRSAPVAKCHAGARDPTVAGLMAFSLGADLVFWRFWPPVSQVWVKVLPAAVPGKAMKAAAITAPAPRMTSCLLMLMASSWLNGALLARAARPLGAPKHRPHGRPRPGLRPARAAAMMRPRLSVCVHR